MQIIFCRNAYNYDTDQASEESGLSCPEPTMTQQQFKEECDINTITRLFGITGQLPENVRAPMYGDFTGISDYRSALEAMHQAEESFMQLPAHVRERFTNDPQRLVEFCSDSRNRDEAIKLGLIFIPPATPAASASPVSASPVAQPQGGATPHA